MDCENCEGYNTTIDRADTVIESGQITEVYLIYICEDCGHESHEDVAGAFEREITPPGDPTDD